MAGPKVPLTFRIFKGDQLLREERLSLSVIKLGKVPSAHLKLDDETVSRMHAIIEVNGPGDVSIIDLGSTKGTFVNGQKVNKAKLQSGDTIVVGETRIELSIGVGEEEGEEPTKVNTAAAPPPAEAFRPGPGPAPSALAQTMAAPPPMPSRQPPAAPQSFAPPPAPAFAPPAFGSAPPAAFGAPPPAYGSAPPALRAPPGMQSAAPMYGTAMAPPAGFQQNMAEAVDDLGGARAVEVAAMLGDSVINVKHCINPRGGKVSGTTYAFFAIGIAMLLASVVSFGLSVSNAATNKGRYDYVTGPRVIDPKTNKLKGLGKPGYSVRPVQMSMGFDWMAFGGLAIALVSLTYGLARLRGERQDPTYRIGTAPGVTFATEGAPGTEFPLISANGDEFAFNFGPGMEGEMIVGGQSTTLGELASQGRTTISPIPPNAKIRVRTGKTTFLVSAVPQPRRHAAPIFAAVELAVLVCFGGSLVVHLGFVAMLSLIPVEDSGANLDLASLEDTNTRTSGVNQDDPPPPEEEEKPDDGNEESGGTGTAMALDEGKMGKKDSERAEGQFTMKKNAADPQLARQQAMEQARNAGILGSSALAAGGAFASLTGTGDLSSGMDDSDIYGGLLGNEAGEMNGGFGYGRSGFGPGGGGTGWGTIGTGRYGTIGHGSGTGNGYGVGGGRGGMKGRTAAVPTVSIGAPSASGDLDKAIIRRYIKRNQQKFQYCYEKALLANSELSGTVSIQFFISPNGTVAQSGGSGVSPEVAGCVAAVIKAIEFPKPKGGGGVQVNYPFEFRRSGGG